MARKRGNDGSALDVRRIVEAAWTLVDREGVAALSTRSLAAELDVQGPALYWHIRSKQELLGLMVEHVLRDAIGVAPANLGWADWLRLVGREQRRALLRHRDSGLIASSASPTPRLRDEVFPQVMEPLLDAGIAPREASAAAGALAGLVLGWVLYEQRPETREFVLAFHDPDEAFDYAIDALVCGVEAKSGGDPRRV
jgi:TetR/AcrR family tetracycline transcriptional repressor